MDSNMLIVAVIALAAGFAIRGWMAHLERTAKTRALRMVAKGLAIVEKLDGAKDTATELAQQQAAEAAAITNLAARIAALK